MKRKIRIGFTTALLLLTVDAAVFMASHKNAQAEVSEKALQELMEVVELHVDDISGVCPGLMPRECTFNTVDSHCYQLACLAQYYECNGDYSSGPCKDIGDVHDSACFGARSGCGDVLPLKYHPPECDQFWNYGCRLREVFANLASAVNQ